MDQRMFALSLGFVGVILAVQAAHAAPQCGLRADVVAALSDQYGETRRGVGLAANGMMVEVFASAVSGTWTITATAPDGQACLVASGQSYESVVALAPGAPT